MANDLPILCRAYELLKSFIKWTIGQSRQRLPGREIYVSCHEFRGQLIARKTVFRYSNNRCTYFGSFCHFQERRDIRRKLRACDKLNYEEEAVIGNAHSVRLRSEKSRKPLSLCFSHKLISLSLSSFTPDYTDYTLSSCLKSTRLPAAPTLLQGDPFECCLERTSPTTNSSATTTPMRTTVLPGKCQMKISACFAR
jgi:hypothetical protein